MNPNAYSIVKEILNQTQMSTGFIYSYFNKDHEEERQIIIKETVSFLENLQAHLEKTFSEINFSENSLIISEFAGNGDSIHTKLLIQNLIQNKGEFVVPSPGGKMEKRIFRVNDDTKIYWLCNPLVQDLYKDETSFKAISNGIIGNNKFRIPCGYCMAIYSIISDMLDFLLQSHHNKINLSEIVCAYHVYGQMGNPNSQSTFCDPFYVGTGVSRDPSIKHSINHLDTTNFKSKIPNEKYIVIEHSATGKVFSEETVRFYEDLILLLKGKGYESAIVGGKNDPEISGAINYLGESLYDTYTLVKHSSGFISSNSGNSTLVYFFDDLPVIEINTQINTPMSTSRLKYKNNMHYANFDDCFQKVKEVL